MNSWRLNTLGYFHGRFQPFHLGHLAVVRTALERHAFVAIGISNPFRGDIVAEEKLSNAELASLQCARDRENNPWPYWARVLMIREGVRRAGISLDRIVCIPNLRNTGCPVEEMRFPRDLTTVYLAPKGEHNKAAAREYRRRGWKIEELPVCEQGVGSYQIRQLMARGDEWAHLVPDGTADVIKALAERYGAGCHCS